MRRLVLGAENGVGQGGACFANFLMGRCSRLPWRHFYADLYGHYADFCFFIIFFFFFFFLYVLSDTVYRILTDDDLYRQTSAFLLFTFLMCIILSNV